MNTKLTRFELNAPVGEVVIRLEVPTDDGSRRVYGEATVPLDMDKSVRAHVDAAWEDGVLEEHLTYQKALAEADIARTKKAGRGEQPADKTPDFTPKRTAKAKPDQE